MAKQIKLKVNNEDVYLVNIKTNVESLAGYCIDNKPVYVMFLTGTLGASGVTLNMTHNLASSGIVFIPIKIEGMLTQSVDGAVISRFRFCIYI